MRLSSQGSQFVFNLPQDFVPQEILNSYTPLLEKNWVQYENVLDYLNSTIKSINLPGISFDTPQQMLVRGKVRKFKPATNVQDILTTHEATVNFRSVDSDLNYWILFDIIIKHYLNTDTNFLKPFSISVVDIHRDAIYTIHLKEIIIKSFSDLQFDYSQQKINNKEFTNNSKKILAYTLNNESKNQDENINESDVLFDIFNLNDLETDTVRLSASTIKQLFEDTGYNLKDVREKKLVKPVALTLLPSEIKMIENTTQIDFIQAVSFRGFETCNKYEFILNYSVEVMTLDTINKIISGTFEFDLLNENGILMGLLFNKIFENPGPPIGGDIEEYLCLFQRKFLVRTLEECRNSIKPRQGSELFMELMKG